MTDLILYQRNGEVATVTINRPDKRNALNEAMWLALGEAIASAAEDSAVRTLILTGTGEQAFCGGADIGELSENITHPGRQQTANDIIQRVQAQLEELPKPTIAVIRGACFGGGCGLALACDFRIAAPHSQFAITPAKLGLLYSLRDTRRLFNLVGPSLTREMLLTAAPISAERALASGLVDRLVDAAGVMAEAELLAAQMAANSAGSQRGIKATLAHLQGIPAPDEAALAALFDEAFSSDDFAEGSQAFLEKRKPQF